MGCGGLAGGAAAVLSQCKILLGAMDPAGKWVVRVVSDKAQFFAYAISLDGVRRGVALWTNRYGEDGLNRTGFG